MTTLNPIRVLYVDDYELDRTLVRDALSQDGGFLLTEAASQTEFEHQLARGDFDVILSDYDISGFEGLQVFDLTRDRFPDVPVVIVTGTGSEEVAVAAFRKGVADYIIKAPGHIRRLPFTIRTAVETSRLQRQHRESIAALSESEARFRRLLLKLPVAAYTCDATGLLTQFNERAVELWGRTPRLRDPADRYCGAFRMYKPDGTYVPHDKCLMTQLLDTPEGDLRGEAVIERPDGSRSAALVQVSPLYDALGRLSGGVGVFVDITQLKQAEAERQAAQHQLAERLQCEKEIVEADLAKARASLVRSTQLATIGRMAAQMAHELRNPLGAVRNAAYYIRNELGQASSDLVEMLEVIDEELAVADVILRDLLNVSHPSPPHLGSVDVVALLKKSFTRMRGGDEIVLHLDAPDEGLTIDFDALQLRQLVDNLLNNSRDAIGGVGSIWVQVRRGTAFHELRVSDSGPGIPPDLAEAVFEPFFTTKKRGIGLGLAICRQIVEQHGGTVHVEHDRGNTTIVTRVPVRETHKLNGRSTQTAGADRPRGQ